MNEDYSLYEKLYIIKDDLYNISHCIELDNNSILSLNTLNELNLITFNILENNEIKDRKKNVNDFLLDIDQTVLSIRKIGDNIICLNLTRKDDFELICRLSGVRITLTDIEEKENSLRQYSIVETDFNVMDNLEKNPLGKIGNNNLEIYTGN